MYTFSEGWTKGLVLRCCFLYKLPNCVDIRRGYLAKEKVWNMEAYNKGNDIAKSISCRLIPCI